MGFEPANEAKFEQKINQIGRSIFEKSNDLSVGLFDKAYWSGKMMDWSMKNEAFKIEMFRFVDVLPSLVNSEQIVRHMKEYFLREGVEPPPFVKTALGLAGATGLTAKMAAASVKKNVEAMASTFITGQDSESARKTLEKLWNEGFAFTVDILGEAVVSEAEAQSYQARYLELVQGLPRLVKSWKAQARLDESPMGPVPRANISVKCSSLYSQIDNLAYRKSVEAVKERLRPILREAMSQGAFINLDMEQNDLREMFTTVAEEIFFEDEFRGYPHFGVVIQAYLKNSLHDVERAIAFARRRETPFCVRLVKGAYWDYEVIQSQQRNWPEPVFINKAQTDLNYEACTEKLLRAWPAIHVAFGSHNVRSLAYAMALADEIGLQKGAFEIQMLYGMADSFKKALSSMGYRVREYAPVGEMLPGMAYLVRRLLENTSNEGFLRASVTGADVAELLKAPALRVQEAERAGKLKKKEYAQPFVCEALLDFSQASVRERLDEALKTFEASVPALVLPVVNGVEKKSLRVFEGRDPSNSERIVAKTHLAARDLALEAVAVAKGAQKKWEQTSVTERAAALRKAADLMRTRRYDLAATMVFEVGKNAREADADVAEAIDFCDYYAAEMEKLAKGRELSSPPGEANVYEYRARGVALAIAPWNFPFAILCGMTVAPLVAGNAVIMKPAEQSSLIGLKLYKILREAGIPAEVLQFLPGDGEEIGPLLVEHRDVHVVSFTGSRAVGLKIYESAAKTGPGQRHVKRVIAEMGGKNAMIVDDDADLDEAVVACIHSAFGFQGQKCSALSRLIVLGSNYEKFKHRLSEAIGSLKIGPAHDPTSKIGPVIDSDAAERLRGVIERNRSKIVAQLALPSSLPRGNYIPPTIFEESDFSSELGQIEFFGPLVTLFRVESLDEAFRAMNDVDYALTGGFFSRSPEAIKRARVEIEVGNLYINRGITGALVGRQPFGGFKLSGMGAKAGGPDYLLQFLEPVTQTENTMRRGFAPEV